MEERLKESEEALADLENKMDNYMTLVKENSDTVLKATKNMTATEKKDFIEKFKKNVKKSTEALFRDAKTEDVPAAIILAIKRTKEKVAPEMEIEAQKTIRSVHILNLFKNLMKIAGSTIIKWRFLEAMVILGLPFMDWLLDLLPGF